MIFTYEGNTDPIPCMKILFILKSMRLWSLDLTLPTSYMFLSQLGTPTDLMRLINKCQF